VSHRAAPAGRTRTSKGPLWSLFAPLLAVASVAGLLAWSSERAAEPAAEAASSRQVALDDVTLVCQGDNPDSKVSVAIGLLPGADTAGTVTLGPRELPVQPGGWSTATLGDRATPVAAQGPVATSIGAWRSSVAGDASGGGLATSGCARPGTDAWFLGAGSAVDHASTVVVSNAGQTAAVFSLSLLTPDELMEPVATQGVALAPGAEQVVELAENAGGIDDVAVRVRTTEGQVAVSVLDRWTESLAPAGTEWLPAAGEPDTSVSLTGIPAGTGDRELVVANTGERTSVVRVEVVGPRTTFVSDELAELEVPGLSTLTVPFPAGLDRDALGVRVESDSPVLATVRSRTDGRRPDVAYAVPTASLDGSTAVPLRLGDPPGRLLPVLSLTTAGTGPPATVEVIAFGADGAELDTASVEVPGGLTTTFDAGRQLSGRAAFVVLTPREGAPVQAAATYTTRSGLLSVLPLTTAPSAVLAPVARPEP
jgi:hypothetical protein